MSTLVLSKPQSATVKRLDAEGWRLSVLRHFIDGTLALAAYSCKSHENRVLAIDEEGRETWQ